VILHRVRRKAFTAKALGIAVPQPPLLLRADAIIR
jgi:hypothetical protein